MRLPSQKAGPTYLGRYLGRSMAVIGIEVRGKSERNERKEKELGGFVCALNSKERACSLPSISDRFSVSSLRSSVHLQTLLSV